MRYDKRLKPWTVVAPEHRGAISQAHLDTSTGKLYATNGRALLVAPVDDLSSFETSGSIPTRALKACKGRLTVDDTGSSLPDGSMYPREDLGTYPDIPRIEQEFASDEVKGEILLNGNYLMAVLAAMGFSASTKPTGAAQWVKVQVSDPGRPMKLTSDYKGVKAYVCPVHGK